MFSKVYVFRCVNTKQNIFCQKTRFELSLPVQTDAMRFSFENGYLFVRFRLLSAPHRSRTQIFTFQYVQGRSGYKMIHTRQRFQNEAFSKVFISDPFLQVSVFTAFSIVFLRVQKGKNALKGVMTSFGAILGNSLISVMASQIWGKHLLAAARLGPIQ